MIAILLPTANSYGQSHYTIALPEKVIPIDINSLDGVHMHVVTQNVIYEVNGVTLEPLITFENIDLTIGKNSITHFNKDNQAYPSYSVVQGGYISILNKDSINRYNFNAIPQSVYNAPNTTIIDIGHQKLNVENDSFSIQTAPIQMTSVEHSIASIQKENQLSEIIQTYVCKDSTLKILTTEKLYSYSNNKLTIDYTVDLSGTEELLSLEVDRNHNIWLLSNNKINIITPKYLHRYDLLEGDKNYHLYKIRNNYYSTNGSQVLQLIDEKWANRKDLLAPLNTIIDTSFNPYLINNNGAVKHNKLNAVVLERLEGFYGEIITHINQKYTCTTHNVYNDGVKVSNVTDYYYKTISTKDKLIAIGQSGIYTYNNEGLQLVLSKTLPYSKNYSIIDSNIIFFTENTINTLSINKPDNESIISLKNLKILDILLTSDHLLVLNSNSLLYLDSKAILRGRIDVKKVLPIAPPLSQGQLQILDNEIWISSNSEVIRIDNNYSQRISLPFLFLDVNNIDEHRLQPSLKSENFYSNNINYTYYINGSEGTRTIWTNEPKINLDNNSKSSLNIIAKMHDNVFAQDIYSNNISIPAPEDNSIDRMIKIIAAILATLLILWAIKRQIRT